MGGGGGVSSRYTPSDVDKLEDIARREITRKPSPKPRRRVFLSFRGRDRDLVDEFRARAKDEESELDFIDFSLAVPFKSENAEYIMRGIRERIKNSSVTVVLVGESTHQSEWVDWEIRESLKMGKGVIAVKLSDGSVTTPPALKEHGIKVMGRNERKISQAIQEAAEKE